jgi:hypothetical protein
MLSFLNRSRSVALALALAVSASAPVCQTAVAQAPDAGATPAAHEFPYLAAVTSDDVYVRPGAGVSYNAFGKVQQGDVVQVIGEKFGWARIRTMGPAFRYFFGYVKYPKTETGRFRVSADGKTGVTLGLTEIWAPNLDMKSDPRHSIKWITRLPADSEVVVLESSDADDQRVHKVRLPESGEGWINIAYLRKATAEEAAAFSQPPASVPAPREAGASQTPSAPVQPPAPQPEPGAAPVTPAPAAAAEDTTGAAAADGASPGEETTLAPPTSAPAEAEKPQPPAPRQPTLPDLEQALQKLSKESPDTAEVGPLRELYLDLARRSDTPGESRYANARAEQLRLWAEVQQRRQDVARLREEAKNSSQEHESARTAMDLRSEYVAIGKLDTSTIFDGSRLPRMLRLQESSTGRTVAYLQLNNDLNLVNMVGQLVGIVGDKTYDEGLRLNLIQPRRVDLLAPRTAGAGGTPIRESAEPR